MADPIIGAATVTPSQIEEAVFQRIGAPQGGSFESWRYNAPAAEGATVYPKSRRKMRMEAEFQQYQAKELEMQRAIAAMNLAQAAEARLQRDQDFQFAEAQTKAEREGRVQDEAGLMIDAMRGAVDNEGNVIANPIRPEDPDAVERLNGLAKQFKYGVENKAAAGMFTQLYNDALKFREERIKESEQNELAAVNLSVRTGKPFEQFGTYDEQGMFQPKMQGMIAGAEEVKSTEEAQQEEKAIAKEGRGEEARAKAREESDKRTRRRQLDEDILAEEQILIDFQNQKPSPSRDTEIKKAEAKLKNLHLRRGAIEGLTSDDLIYKDQDAYKRAIQDGKKIPSGTTIYIGGIPAKVK